MKTFSRLIFSILLGLSVLCSLAPYEAQAATTSVSISSPTNTSRVYIRSGGIVPVNYNIIGDGSGVNVLIEIYQGSVIVATASYSKLSDNSGYVDNVAIPVGVSQGTYDVRITVSGSSTQTDAKGGAIIVDNTGPTVTIVSPNGGESWPSESTRSISFRTTDNMAGNLIYDYFYSTDGGTTWIAINSQPNQLQGTRTYSWPVPALLASNTTARIKITATDSAGNQSSVQSANNFTIAVVGPAVNITAPNGGQHWVAAATQTISWTATSQTSGGMTIEIRYSTDGGLNWPDSKIIATLINQPSGANSYAWTIPSDPTGSCRIKITATSTSGVSGSDVTDSVFEISGAPGSPHQFYGNVTVQGSPAPDGTQLTATVGNLVWSTNVVGGGYGYNTPFIIPADNTGTPAKDGGIAGDTIIFKIEGLQVATAPFAYGSDTRLDLDSTASLSGTVVTTNPASAIAASSATLNGNLTGLGGVASQQVSFEWGTTTDYGSATTAVTRTTIGPFSTALSGLAMGATYHFRAKAVGATTVYGADMTFVAGAIPPTLSTVAATIVSPTSAMLNGALSSLGSTSSVQVLFEWGTTNSYGNTTSPQVRSITGGFSTTISNLSSGTTYHFRAKVIGDGNGTAYGSDVTFNSSGSSTIPVVSTSVASSITTTSATLNGTLTSLGNNSEVQVSFEWGSTNAYGVTTAVVSRTTTGGFSTSVTGLSAGNVYHFRAKAVGAITVYGSDVTFTSAKSTSTPTATPTATPVTAHIIATLLGTNTTIPVDDRNTVSQATQVLSGDGRVQVTLPVGAALTDAQGDPLSSITANVIGTLPMPPSGSQVLAAYEFGPPGATFAPALTLTLKYDAVPAGFVEQNLTIAVLNGAIWDDSNSTVNTVARTVSAQVGHFSTVAIIARPGITTPSQTPSPTPTIFEVSNLTVSPLTVDIGKAAVVTAQVTNKGTVTGSYTVNLKVNGAAYQNKQVTLSPGASEKVTFQVTQQAAGMYSLDIDGKKADFTVTLAGTTAPSPGLAWWVWLLIIAGLLIVARIVWMVMESKQIGPWKTKPLQ